MNLMRFLLLNRTIRKKSKPCAARRGPARSGTPDQTFSTLTVVL
jgi:hypothetical protein